MPMIAPDPKPVCHQLYTDQASVDVDNILQWTALLLLLTISNFLFLLLSDSPSHKHRQLRREIELKAILLVPILVSELIHEPISFFSGTIFKMSGYES